MAFGQPNQSDHMMKGVHAAMKSPKTPKHLKAHLQARIDSAPPIPFGGKPSKKKQPALVTGDEPDTPTDANDDESAEIEPSSPMPQMGVGPIQAAAQKTPRFPSKSPVASVKPRPQFIAKKPKNVKMVKGNKIPSGFFG